MRNRTRWAPEPWRPVRQRAVRYRPVRQRAARQRAARYRTLTPHWRLRYSAGMDIPIWSWAELDAHTRERLLSRSQQDIDAVLAETHDLVSHVRTGGDSAVCELVSRFDGVPLQPAELEVPPRELNRAEQRLPRPIREALQYAIDNVRSVHSAQVHTGMSAVEPQAGLSVMERHTPVDSVGLYVPRGRGSFPSMLYMMAVPAKLAGVPDLAVATPPAPDGSVDDACLVAARLCGVDRIYRMGGPVAVAAFAYGTESVGRVYKIVGPGSARVAAAKRVVAGDVDTGLPAGPTESILVADDSADAELVAYDLMIEAEHGSDSQAMLITPSRELAEQVAARVPVLASKLPENRQQFVRDVLTGYGGILLTRDLEEAVEIVNAFAPEHLLIQTFDPEHTAAGVRNASEILLGTHTPFSLANYGTGANAVLPTGGHARSFSAVSVRDFQKRASVVRASETAFREIAPHVIALADCEDFPAHAAALRARLDRQQGHAPPCDGGQR